MPPVARRIDPSRTTLIQNAFARDLAARQYWLAEQVIRHVETENSYGLPRKTKPVHNVVQNAAYQFLTSGKKLQAFSSWLQAQVDSGLLGLVGQTDPDNPLTAQYITSAYRQGIVRAYIDAHPELRTDPEFYAKAQAVFLKDTFASPIAIERVESLATRTFEEMKGLGAAEKTSLNRILADGMANGDAVEDVARDMVDQIDNMTQTRAMVIARTEIVRAHAEGQLDAFAAMGMEELGMEAEWSTADDDAVCEDCQDAADDSPYTLDEARGMIPLHPNCRCAWIPMQVKEQQDRTSQAATEEAAPPEEEEAAPVEEEEPTENVYDPDEPRDEKGQWSATGAIGMEHGMTPALRVGKTWQATSGDALPEHVAGIGIPPGWKQVQINPDPTGRLQAVGVDTKGRIQRIYSEEHVRQQALEKFDRVNAMASEHATMVEQNNRNLESEDPKTREAAAAMAVIIGMGIRPGSDKDTQGAVQAYGATTLEGRHVVTKGDETRLEFIGKKGVSIDLPVDDDKIAGILRDRAAQAGEDGRLFDVSQKTLEKYATTLGSGDYSPKDFRTYLGTALAQQAASQYARAATMKEYKGNVKAIAQYVSLHLGNTPVVALQSYINPSVFEPLKPRG